MDYETLINCHQLAGLDAATDMRIVDCRFDLADTGRGRREYTRAHIPGACYAHLDDDLSGPVTRHTGRHPLPEPGRLARWLGGRGVGNGTQVVAYDDSGGTMAVRLWWLLRWLGHSHVAILDGGWQAWCAAGLAVETADPDLPAATFGGTPDPSLTVSTGRLAHAVAAGSDDILIMDARSGERFRGESEPIDPVAGHIPGAINVPLQGNLDAGGRFESADVLHARYRRALGNRDPSRVVAMCGSGVTACHNLLAMEIAGLPGGRLYAGSWSEWIRDPQRPLVRGD